MYTLISAAVKRCLRSFDRILRLAKRQPREESDELGLNLKAWEDEQGRFRMWTANIGAHQSGQSSLDYRLKDASHLRLQVLGLLQDLQERIEEAQDVISDMELATGHVTMETASDSEDDTTDIQAFRESVATVIDCLFQLSMLVRKPAQHDFLRGLRRADVVGFEQVDCQHVRDKYPRASEELVARLGEALTKRRGYLKYRARHALKLRQGLDGDTNDASQDDGSLSETMVTKLVQSSFHIDDEGSDTGASQTSYAQTVLDEGTRRVPRPPKASRYRKPFECPYCHLIITTSGTYTWTKHVYRDLQPYVCIWGGCPSKGKLYRTRRDWQDHLDNVHYVVSDSSTATKSSGQRAPQDCPLCHKTFRENKAFSHHVARHLRAIALFALPLDDEELDQEDELNEEESPMLSDSDPSSIENETSLDRHNDPLYTSSATTREIDQTRRTEDEWELFGKSHYISPQRTPSPFSIRPESDEIESAHESERNDGLGLFAAARKVQIEQEAFLRSRRVRKPFSPPILPDFDEDEIARWETEAAKASKLEAEREVAYQNRKQAVKDEAARKEAALFKMADEGMRQAEAEAEAQEEQRMRQRKPRSVDRV